MKKQNRRARIYKLVLWFGLMATLILLGCAAPEPSKVTIQPIPAGDPAAGVVAFQTYGCHTCHVIPGVRNANSLAAPPLTAWAERSYIAGKLTNEPVHLIEWLRFPQRIEPGTAMPDMGVTAEDAHHMAAYLYTLCSNRTWHEQTVHWLRLDQWGLTQSPNHLITQHPLTNHAGSAAGRFWAAYPPRLVAPCWSPVARRAATAAPT